MKTPLTAALAATLFAAAGTAALAQTLPEPANDHDTARQERMEEAYRDHLRQQSSSSMESTRPGAASRFEDAAKRDAHKAGQALRTGAHRTGEAVRTAAHRTGNAVRHGVRRIEGKPDAASSPSA
jgi:Flp pilus assembly protein TadB